METILLQGEKDKHYTLISNIFVEEYMPSANGEYVKVYLYLLKCIQSGDNNFSIASTADIFEHTEKDIMRALIYWERMGALELQYNASKELSGVTVLELKSLNPTPDFPETKKIDKGDNNSVSAIPDSSEDTSSIVESVKKCYSNEEIDAFAEKEDVRQLLFVAEKYFKRPLSRVELNAFLFWYDEYDFSIELIDYLIEYCVDRNHKNVYYMNKVAAGWADVNVKTVAQAKNSVKLHSTANYAVMKAFGIKNRNLVDLEISMIKKWTEEYKFSLDIITEACNRTIQSAHVASFEYADKILSNWHSSGVTEISDIAELDEQHKSKKKASPNKNNSFYKPAENQFKNFTERTYDYSELEKEVLNRHRS